MLDSFGTLVYRDSGGVFVDCEHSLGQYLRKLFYFNSYKTQRLQRPSRREHITISDNYLGLRPYENCTVYFSLARPPKTNGNAYWFEVVSRDVDGIATALCTFPARPWHFCVGYLRDGKAQRQTQ